MEHYDNLMVLKGIGKVGNINVGLSIEPDTSLSMGLEVNYDRWDLLNDIHQTNIFDYKTTPDERIDLGNQRGELENELWVNYSLEKNLKSDRILKVSLTTGGEDETNFTKSEEVANEAFPDVIEQFLLSSDETETQRYYQGKIDFETPSFKGGTLEAGIKTDFIRYNILQKAVLRSNTITLPDNDFSMDMQKLGIYVLQNHQIKKLEYALGLRLEQFSSEAIQHSDETTFTQDYTRLFPSVQFNYLMPDQDHTLGFNYTRRINRPGFFDLNPFISYEDPLNLETGNPALRPEIADLYELNYHLGLDKTSMDVTLYSRSTTDAIQSIVNILDENRSLSTYVNIGEETSQGVEMQLEYRLNKIFKTTGTFVLGQQQYTDLGNEISYNNQKTWSMRLKQRFQLKNDWKIELTETYRAPRYQIQEKVHEMYYMNLAISKKFNNKRGSFSLGVSDLFNTRQYKYSLLTSEFEVEKRYKWQTRQIKLGLRYKIVS